MVAISKVRNFRTRLSLSEILSDLIRCKLVRYPWFCSARPRSFTLSKWQMCITRIEVNFPLKVKRPSDFCSEIRYAFHFVIKFNVLVDFRESCKKSVISKIYAFDSACFCCCAQSLKKVHEVFYSQCAFNNVGHIWLMSSSRCWDGRWCP